MSLLLPRFDEQDVTPTVKCALTRLNNEATASDLVIATGIPFRYVEESLEVLARRYASSYRVSQAGEVLYRFPNGFREGRKDRPSLRSRLLRFRRAAATIAGGLFKRWLLVLLAGYSAVFLTLLFPPVLIIFAILLGSWFRGDFLRVYGERDYYGYRVRAVASCRIDTWRPMSQSTSGFPTRTTGEKMPPAHESLHTYLFGDTRAATLERQKRLSAVLSFIGEQHGIVSLDEIMILTGMSHEEAEAYVTQLLLSYRGEPAVTARGTIVYEFAELARADSAQTRWARLARCDSRSTDAASGIPEESQKSQTRTINTLNLFNLFFGVYYAALSLECLTGKTPVGATGYASMSFLFNSVYSFIAASHLVHAVPAIFLLLGIVPAGIASLFFLLHLRARRRCAVSQRAQRKHNLRQQIYAGVLSQPATVDPTKITIEEPFEPREIPRAEINGVLDELAVDYDAEIEDAGDEHYVYHFTELARRLRDVGRRRAHTAYDSQLHST